MAKAEQLRLFPDPCSECDEPRYARGFCLRHYKADYYRRNLAKAREQRRAYYEANREELKRYSREWYRERTATEEGRKRALDQRRAWAAANREKVRANNHIQKAKRADAPVIDRVYRAVVWERDEGTCQLCGKPADPEDWHLDHVIPLAKGGEHSYDNVAVSHPLCNLRKGTKLVDA